MAGLGMPPASGVPAEAALGRARTVMRERLGAGGWHTQAVRMTWVCAGHQRPPAQLHSAGSEAEQDEQGVRLRVMCHQVIHALPRVGTTVA